MNRPVETKNLSVATVAMLARAHLEEMVPSAVNRLMGVVVLKMVMALRVEKARSLVRALKVVMELMTVMGVLGCAKIGQV